MTRRIWKVPLAALVCALAFGLGCSDDPHDVIDDDPDVEFGVDAGADADPGVDPDAGDDPDVGPDAGDDPEYQGTNFVQVASGGGTLEGGGYRAVVGFGAPIPRGSSEGGGYRVQFGPVSP